MSGSNGSIIREQRNRLTGLPASVQAVPRRPSGLKRAVVVEVDAAVAPARHTMDVLDRATEVVTGTRIYRAITADGEALEIGAKCFVEPMADGDWAIHSGTSAAVEAASGWLDHGHTGYFDGRVDDELA